jgi:hypothetical protein
LRGKRKRDEHAASRFEIRVILREERKGKGWKGKERKEKVGDDIVILRMKQKERKRGRKERHIERKQNGSGVKKMT